MRGMPRCPGVEDGGGDHVQTGSYGHVGMPAGFIILSATGFDMYVVAVKVVEDQHIVVSCGGDMRKTASLICEDLAGCRETLCEHYVGVTAG